jgi:hypothetical protein
MTEQTGTALETIKPCRPKWAGTLTDRERFNRIMRHEPVDRCFNMEFGYWKENYHQWPGLVQNNIKTEAQANRFFNFDRIESIGGNIWMSPPFEPRLLSETDTVQQLINEDGLIGEVPKDGHSTIPHFTQASITTPADWERVKAERFVIDVPERKVDLARLQRLHPADRTYPLGVNCGSMIGKVRDVLTFEGLAYSTYDYPDMVEDMVETACLLVEDFLDQVLGHIDFDFASGWEDICFRNGPIVSVDFFEKIVVPRYQRIGARLKRHGIDLWYTDCDGDIRPLLPGFLRGGINCMFPFEVNASGHPLPLLQEYGPQLRIMGGVDKTKLAGGHGAIRDWLESLLPAVERGGFIPHCDHRCPPDVPYDDYLFYLDLKQQMFGMQNS